MCFAAGRGKNLIQGILPEVIRTSGNTDSVVWELNCH